MNPSKQSPIARLRFESSVPYGGMFVLKMPDRGLVGKATSFAGLCREVRTWRKANAWPIGLGLTSEIEKAVCEAYPDECHIEDNRIPNRSRRYSLASVIQGTKAMVRHKLNGSVLVDATEANRRASICKPCPNNVSFSKPCSGTCAELKELVETIIGSKRTQYDEELKSCAICKCFLGPSVWVPLEIQTADLTEDQKIQFEYAASTVGCWKHS